MSSQFDAEKMIASLQRGLDARAEEATRRWWEDYMKGAIPFRGVKMADIRAELHAWVTAERIDDWPADEQRDLALRLIRQTYCEDKLAGVLYLQERLLPAGHLRWPADLPRFAALFTEGAIYEWNTCDWFCVRVLGPLAQREGETCAQAIAEWRHSDNLWQRRAAGVAFVNYAPDGDGNFPGFTDMLLAVCDAAVRSPERFAQTGTGWVLRELSHAEPEKVARFVEDHLPLFSTEGFNYSTAKLPEDKRTRLKGLRRRGQAPPRRQE